MSSERPVLKLHRPLAGVRPVGRAALSARPSQAAAENGPPAPGDQMRRGLEATAARLAEREAELSRAETALAAKEAELDAKLAALARLIGSVNEEKAEMLAASEEEIISFSLSISEKVLQYELDSGRYRMGEVVKSTLQAVRDRGRIVVRVNPRDLELTQAALGQMSQQFGTAGITCVADEAIPLASCCIETDSGKVFSEIPGRLERIEKSLLKKNGDPDGI